jgi:flagellar biosynthesis protein
MSDREPTNPPAGATGKRTVTVAIGPGETAGAVPRVTAAAQGALAERLLEIAFEHGIPVRQDADLAEIIAAMEIDSEIPVAAFAAVAEILSYVYRLNRGDIDPADEATWATGAPWAARTT